MLLPYLSNAGSILLTGVGNNMAGILAKDAAVSV